MFLQVYLKNILFYNIIKYILFTGPSSKIHDSRVLKLSPIGKKLRGVTHNGAFHIIGDSAYPISECLLTPFRRSLNMNPVKAHFNRLFCATRVKVENAFALLKARFRQLMLLEFHRVEKAAMFQLACCVLHNLCIDAGDNEFGRLPPVIEVDDEPLHQARADKILGEAKRNVISEELFYH